MSAESPQGGSAARDDEISILRLVAVLLKHRYLIVVPVILLWVVVGVSAIMKPRQYTAETSFLGNSNRQEGRASQLAGQFGSLLGVSTTPSESPEFYAELVRTPEIVGRVLADSVSVGRTRSDMETDSVVSVIDALEIEGPSQLARQANGVKWLRKRIAASSDLATGIVEVRVTTSSPVLSGYIAQRLVDLVAEFNRVTRQSQAAAERSFVSERMREADDSLAVAQDALRRFLESNRQFENSAELRFEYDRLQREVSAQWEMLSSHRQAYEAARVAEVRNTPVITVVDQARTPVEPDARGLLIRLIVAAMVGAFLGIGLALIAEFVAASKRSGDEDYYTLRAAWDEAREDLRRVVTFGRG